MRLILALLVVLVWGSASSAAEITGAGSTFAYPFFSRAFYAYNKAHPDVTIRYQPIGSDEGFEQFSAKTVDFGATDAPMDPGELSAVNGAVLQVPVALSGEGLAYNLPGVAKGLHLTREAVADIYLGKITEWNDPTIVALNPNVNLPAIPITDVYRSDDSGITYIFTDFLSAVSPAWKQTVGTGRSVSWPAPRSVGGKGNGGIADMIRRIPGAIGYLELSYLLENDLAYAQVQNKAGKYLYPDIASVTAAAAMKPEVSAEDFSITDAAGPDSYPIGGYSWVLLYKAPEDAEEGAQVKQLMSWLVTEGQSIATTVDCVPLPENVRRLAEKILDQMEVK